MMSSEPRLVIAILRDAGGEEVLKALLDANFRVTQIASTGGFLRRGNSTLSANTVLRLSILASNALLSSC